MLDKEVLRICRTSAETYLNYLKSKNKGREQIKATVSEESEGIFVLRLAKPLFSFGSELMLNIDGNELTGKEFLFPEYDQDKLLLFVRPTNEKSVIVLREAHEIYVVSDLTFLVSRLKDAYTNLNRLYFPLSQGTACSFFNFSDSMSLEQKNAVKCCLQNGQAYVWGAPGTGKTRYVLSNCLRTLLNNIDKEKKIVVLAPTNNALEQVLYGVLGELEKARISQDIILRLGIPTHQFVTHYPKICEAKGVEKKLAQIQDQISLNQKILKYRDFCLRYSAMEQKIMPLFEKTEDILLKLHSIKQSASQAKDDIRQYRYQLESAEKQVRQNKVSLAILEERLERVPFKAIPLLSGRKIKNIEKEIETQRIIVNTGNDTCAQIKRMQADALLTVSSSEKMISDATEELDTTIASLQIALRTIPSLCLLAEKLSVNTLQSIKTDLTEKMRQGLSFIRTNRPKYEEYAGISSSSIQIQINDLEETRTHLQEETRKSRIERAVIIAATVDTFFGAFPPDKYAEQNVNIAHIFLDEAGYCSLIKGILLTSYNCPITLLGDHMQLPPVCEMDRSEINQKRDNQPIILWWAPAIYLENAFAEDSLGSLYESLNQNEAPVTNRLKKVNLTKTYRFDEKLASILDKYVYHNGFSSALSDSSITIKCIDAPFLAGFERHQSKSEADIICDIIDKLDDNEYAVLTPYRNQRKLIQELSRLSPIEKSQKILTVHASQGREWETVILSVSDASADWFTNTKKSGLGALQLLNTAVSRTKKNLLIVCNKNYWENQNGQFITELIRHSA